eukprot:SAG22_NODE_1835_length_3468_cov_3.304541_3_plen_64_part_00
MLKKGQWTTGTSGAAKIHGFARRSAASRLAPEGGGPGPGGRRVFLGFSKVVYGTHDNVQSSKN